MSDTEYNTKTIVSGILKKLLPYILVTFIMKLVIYFCETTEWWPTIENPGIILGVIGFGIAILLGAIFFGIYWLIISENTFFFWPGFFVGYASYLYVHYIVHAWKPPKNFFKILWEHHNLHHYVYDDKAYGVSSPLWDVVFGTMPPKGKPIPRQKRRRVKKQSAE